MGIKVLSLNLLLLFMVHCCPGRYQRKIAIRDSEARLYTVAAMLPAWVGSPGGDAGIAPFLRSRSDSPVLASTMHDNSKYFNTIPT